MQKVLIATPAAGGLVSTTYLSSMITTLFMAASEKSAEKRLGLGSYTLANESLVNRGRNHCAAVALSQDWDKLFFIDADVGWSWEQFDAVVKNCSAKDGRGIVAGACPLKTYPIGLNYLPWPDDEKYYEKYEMKKDPRALRKQVMDRAAILTGQKSDEDPELISVPCIGTAFMCIDVQVLRDLKESTPYYVYPNPITGEPSPHWDFFSVGPIKNKFVSEDWSFCYKAGEIGHKTFVHAGVIVKHTGSHTFECDVQDVDKNIMCEITGF